MGHTDAVTIAGESGPERERFATFMLLLVTLFWGMSFPWLKDWLRQAGPCPGGEALGALTMLGVRMSAAFAVIAVCMPRQTFLATPREHAAGAAIGLVFGLGSFLQTWGLNTTTPALSAIFTSLACAWVPLVARVFFALRPSAWTMAGFVLSVSGTLVFAVPDRDQMLGTGLRPGDWLTMLASLAFACQILSLDRLGRHARPGRLTAGFFAAQGIVGLALAVPVAAAGPGLPAWWDWTCGMLQNREALWSLVWLTLVPAVLGFHWMNKYQPRVSASRAALIYLLEPVFAAVFSVSRGKEPVTVALLVGGSLILAGNALAEMPNWLPRKVKLT
jgi:drug/metabolite transporter (DMT)-like permease